MGARRGSKAALKKENAETLETPGNFVLSNKWKIVLAVVLLISIGVQRYFYLFETAEEPREVNLNDEAPFLEVISEVYDDADLTDWEPPPEMEWREPLPGDDGAAVIVPREFQNEAKERFAEHEFNVVASEFMSLNRTLADNRFPECQAIQYSHRLPTASVIIVFHNEAWSTLIRTLWSVYTKSPKSLLNEIILVDDYSDRDYLQDQLEDYLHNLPFKVILLRSPKRAGLIQARLAGARRATGQVLTFLDAHCECNEGWLEPLLARIAENRKVVISPVIDVITDDTFQLLTAVTEVYGAFDWGLTFKWLSVPDRELERINNDRSANIRPPAMAGGLFAIDKEYFYKLGSYDEGMIIWGGENIEMSFRVWMCGGMLEMTPCSRVGHVFRRKTPYTLPGGAAHVVFSNTVRYVDVWMDELGDLYYQLNPGARPKKSNVSKRKKLRKDLQCKSFRWYLENIYPESTYLLEHHHLGAVANLENKALCLDTIEQRGSQPLAIIECHNLGGNQLFKLTKKHEIRSDVLCAEANYIGDTVRLEHCHGDGDNQKFEYFPETQEFRHSTGENCLTLVNGEVLSVEPCETGLASQKWVLTKPKILLH